MTEEESSSLLENDAKHGNADEEEGITRLRSDSLTAPSESTQFWTRVKDEELRRILTNDDYPQCHMCNGYYGSNHSQPVCSTCHLFLYAVPDLDDEEEYLKKPSMSSTRCRTKPVPQAALPQASAVESDDSGTEQPVFEPLDDDEAIAAELAARAAAAVRRQAAAANYGSLNQLASDMENVRLQGRPEVAVFDRRSAANASNPPVAAVDKSLNHSTAYLLHIKSQQLKRRVGELSKYNPINCPQRDSLVENLPPEVLLQIFQHLDDFALWSAKNVCSKWNALIEAVVPDKHWQMYVRNRWPLFSPRFIVNCWSEVYSLLVNSACCLRCLPSMTLLNTPPICEKAWKHRRLASELRSLQKEPPEGIQAVPLDKDCRFFQALILGPKGSPYEGGRFYLYLQIPKSYPHIPPVVQFITKVLHPNVSRHGNIGLDSIHHNWSLALNLSKILLSIQSLFTDPYLKICMEPSVAKLYKEDRNMFNQAAREWTWKYAMAEVQQVYFGHVDLENGFQPFAARAI